MNGTGVQGLTVVRGGTTVLRDVTLEVPDGELLVVLGSSGSGKSTLLRAIAGLDELTTGEVFIRGRRVTGMPTGGRRAAMVFQADALIPFLDVSRNLGFGLKIQRRPDDEVQQRVTGQARQLRLSRLLPRRPRELSGGERGLVGIGRALVQVPDVFLLDEPLGDLDTVQRTEVRRQIVEVVCSLGVPAFYVTHDPAEGLAIADRVALLHEGGIVQVGRPREVYDRPANVFVAEFLGEPAIGLVTARVVSSGGHAGFEVGTRTVPLWQGLPEPLRPYVGRQVVVGLRPEDVQDAGAGHDANTVTFNGVVAAVEYRGPHTVAGVALTGAPAGTTVHAFFPPRAVLDVGDSVQLAVDGTCAHVFDPDSGRALWHPADATGGDRGQAQVGHRSGQG
jgi:multiple sugar transport system ATP-binding protein